MTEPNIGAWRWIWGNTIDESVGTETERRAEYQAKPTSRPVMIRGTEALRWKERGGEMVVYQSRTSTGKQVGTLERRTRKEDARMVVR